MENCFLLLLKMNSVSASALSCTNFLVCPSALYPAISMCVCVSVSVCLCVFVWHVCMHVHVHTCVCVCVQAGDTHASQG